MTPRGLLFACVDLLGVWLGWQIAGWRGGVLYVLASVIGYLEAFTRWGDHV